ncbi:hypothetical protein RHMOL_Rhmol11G0220400 [Rhododendron molle]|uniref:Uncharacterized protein n=1 Tax=Rhododendron molle TaxID=49168 RepID=A0ACC0LW44_RHOML|nr:hypothetical protein RHMOL_Rhmol11G0220400 [Rhododendron molle]
MWSVCWINRPYLIADGDKVALHEIEGNVEVEPTRSMRLLSKFCDDYEDGYRDSSVV